MDIVGPIGKNYIITGVDYFTRKGYAKLISSRRESGVLEFIKSVNEKQKIKRLILDQSKENLGNTVKEYCANEGIELHYTSPFHHQSNGRVERFNRTLQDLIFKNKKDKLLNVRLKKAIEVYNASYHSGIDMSPEEACDEKNWEKIKRVQIDNVIKFNEAHKHKPLEEVFRLNDVVLIKEEVDKRKGDAKFKRRGKIVKVYENNSYGVKCLNKEYKRHASQLKLVVDEPSL